MSLNGAPARPIAPDRIVPVASRTFSGHLILFAVGGAALWVSAVGLLVVVAPVCLVAVAVTALKGTALLLRRPTRRQGAGLVLGSVLAICAQVALALVLLVLYSNANPGWDLS